MTTINLLTAKEHIDSNDSIPIWDSGSGRTRRILGETILAYSKSGSISEAYVDERNHLIFILNDGEKVDAGEVLLNSSISIYKNSDLVDDNCQSLIFSGDLIDVSKNENGVQVSIRKDPDIESAVKKATEAIEKANKIAKELIDGDFKEEKVGQNSKYIIDCKKVAGHFTSSDKSVSITGVDTDDGCELDIKVDDIRDKVASDMFDGSIPIMVNDHGSDDAILWRERVDAASGKKQYGTSINNDPLINGIGSSIDISSNVTVEVVGDKGNKKLKLTSKNSGSSILVNGIDGTGKEIKDKVTNELTFNVDDFVLEEEEEEEDRLTVKTKGISVTNDTTVKIDDVHTIKVEGSGVNLSQEGSTAILKIDTSPPSPGDCLWVKEDGFMKPKDETLKITIGKYFDAEKTFDGLLDGISKVHKDLQDTKSVVSTNTDGISANKTELDGHEDRIKALEDGGGTGEHFDYDVFAREYSAGGNVSLTKSGSGKIVLNYTGSPTPPPIDNYSINYTSNERMRVGSSAWNEMMYQDPSVINWQTMGEGRITGFTVNKWALKYPAELTHSTDAEITVDMQMDSKGANTMQCIVWAQYLEGSTWKRYETPIGQSKLYEYDSGGYHPYVNETIKVRLPETFPVGVTDGTYTIRIELEPRIGSRDTIAGGGDASAFRIYVPESGDFVKLHMSQPDLEYRMMDVEQFVDNAETRITELENEPGYSLPETVIHQEHLDPVVTDLQELTDKVNLITDSSQGGTVEFDLNLEDYFYVDSFTFNSSYMEVNKNLLRKESRVVTKGGIKHIETTFDLMIEFRVKQNSSSPYRHDLETFFALCPRRTEKMAVCSVMMNRMFPEANSSYYSWQDMLHTYYDCKLVKTDGQGGRHHFSVYAAGERYFGNAEVYITARTYEEILPEFCDKCGGDYHEGECAAVTIFDGLSDIIEVYQGYCQLSELINLEISYKGFSEIDKITRHFSDEYGTTGITIKKPTVLDAQMYSFMLTVDDIHTVEYSSPTDNDDSLSLMGGSSSELFSYLDSKHANGEQVRIKLTMM